MRKIFAFSLMAALVLASCSPREQFAPTPQPEIGKTIRATIESDTRTYLVEDGDVFHVLWKAGDIIRVADNDHRAYYQTQDDGVQSATFTYLDKGDPELVISTDSLEYWAYFPADPGRKLPAIQQYCANGIAAAPIRGYYKRASLEEPFDPNFVFKNICGAIKLNLTTTQSDVKVVKIVLRADNGLSGSYGATASKLYYEQVVTTTGSSVTLDCPEVAIGAEPVPFFISVPPYSYGAFSVTVIASDGRTQTRSMKGGEILEIERAKIYDLDLAFNDLQKPAVGATATFAKGADMNTAIKALVNPDAASYSDDDSTVTRMVFVTGSDAFSAVNIADPESESPIYVFWDEATTTITVSTPAPKFVLNANSAYFFHRFQTLTEIEGIDDFDTSNVENMSYFFSFSPKTSITMPATWNYDKVLNTRYMFNECKAETVDVSNMNFENDTSMTYMFGNMLNLTQIIWPDEVNAYNLESMASMFRGCALSLIDLTMFKETSGLLTIRYMFAGCENLAKVKANLDLSALNTGTSGIGYCFNICSENAGTLDLTEFDVSTAPTLSYCFYGTRASILDISTWDTSNVGYMNYLFYRCRFLSTIYLGPDFSFDFTVSPSNMWGGSSDPADNSTSCIPGSLTIYCTPEVADWLARVTTLYHVNNGSWGGGVARPVTFFNIDNPSVEISVTWRG